MAKRYHYTRKSEDHLIVLQAFLQPYQERVELNMAMDTGASHTILDLKFLLSLDVPMRQAKATAEVMTGNGVVEAFIFEVNCFECLGISRTPFRLMAYDFLSMGIVDIYEELIGLDFFRDETLCIDFKNEFIWVNYSA